MKKLFYSLFLLSGILFFTQSCSSDKKDDGNTTFTVTFEMNGGKAIEPQAVTSGARAVAPIPTNNYWAFDNWYTNPELTQVYDFTKAVTSNVTLYASWKEIPQDWSRATASIEVGGNIYGTDDNIPIIGDIIYITQFDDIRIYGYGRDNAGDEARNTDVTFSHTLSNCIVQGTLDESHRNSLSFKIDPIKFTGTETITFKSVESPYVTRTLTFKLPASGEQKALFLAKVPKQVPTEDNIIFEDLNYDCHSLYDALTHEEQQDPAVKTAKLILDNWDDVYRDLPYVLNYSFNGLTKCALEDKGRVAYVDYTANGTFPNGTFITPSWINEDDEYFQKKYTFSSDGKAVSTTRYATDVNGTGATNWDDFFYYTYQFTGTPQIGGSISLYYVDNQSSPSTYSISKTITKKSSSSIFGRRAK